MFIVSLYSIFFVISYLILVHGGGLGSFKGRKIYLFFASVLIMSLYLLVDTKEFPDLPIYEDFFNSILINGRINFSTDILAFEKGYVMLNIISRYLSDNFMIIIFILSMVMSVVLAQSTYKYSRIIWLSYILFICITFYSTIYILRQAFAIIIVLFSLRYVIERNIKKFLLCIIIAFFFHKSALICLPLYILYPLKINIKTLTLVFLITVLLTLFFSYVITLLSTIIIDVADYIKEDAENISVISLMVPFTTLIFSLSCFNGRIEDHNRLFIWMGVVECVLTIMSFIVPDFQQFYRLILYFSIAKIFLLPNAIKSIHSILIRNIVCIVWIVCWLLYFRVTSLYGFQF